MFRLYGKVWKLCYTMNQCSEVHTPTYKIIYKGTRGSDYEPEWLVCEACHEKRHFGTSEDICFYSKTQLKINFEYNLD